MSFHEVGVTSQYILFSSMRCVLLDSFPRLCAAVRKLWLMLFYPVLNEVLISARRNTPKSSMHICYLKRTNGP